MAGVAAMTCIVMSFATFFTQTPPSPQSPTSVDPNVGFEVSNGHSVEVAALGTDGKWAVFDWDSLHTMGHQYGPKDGISCIVSELEAHKQSIGSVVDSRCLDTYYNADAFSRIMKNDPISVKCGLNK